MAIPLSYSFRNLWTRRLTTALTAGGMALVVFVFTVVLMLDAGLKKTLVATGSPDNVVVIRRSAGSEVQSGVERLQAAIVESLPQVALGEGGLRQVSKESVVLIALNKRGSGKPANVVEKIVESGLKTFYKEVCLLDQPYVHDPAKTVAQAVKEAEKTVCAPIAIKGFARYALGEGVEKPAEEG